MTQSGKAATKTGQQRPRAKPPQRGPVLVAALPKINRARGGQGVTGQVKCLYEKQTFLHTQ